MQPPTGLSELLRDLDLFDMADLTAMLASIHQFAVMEAVYVIASQVGFDRDRITTKSSGFFGIG